MPPVRVETVLGTLELLLPEGAELVPDPGVADGEMLAWAPRPELGAFSVSHGPAAGRRAGDLLALEQGFGDEVEVEDDEDGELRLRVVTIFFRDGAGHPLTLSGHKLVKDDAGFDVWRDTTTLFTRVLRGYVDEPTRYERLHFRFWESGDDAVRAGYRLDETAPEELPAAFERATGSLRLEAP